MRKYQYTFKFVDTEQQAKDLCQDIFNNSNDYIKRNKKPHYSAWESQDGTEHKFIVWFWN